jgi:hypothetical protein
MALVALVCVATAVPLAQVAYDRAVPPRQALTLTQREFYRPWIRDENTGEALGWSWQRAPEIDSVDAARMAEVGLPCRDARYDCGLRSGRAGFIVVTLDTLEWRRRVDSMQQVLDSIDAIVPADSGTLRDRREHLSRLEQLRDRESRLVMVDVGRDGDALLARWTDGAHLVLRARLTAYRSTWPHDSTDRPAVRYRIHADPVPAMLYVPHDLAAGVRDTTYDRRAVYQVTVGVGRGWLPRVLEVVQ